MTEQNSNANLEELYPWTDNVTKEGADYEPNDLNNNLMHLKYVHRPKNVAGRNIGDIFWTMRVDESINGAYPCNGGEFGEDDFSGDNNPYNLLVLGRIPSVTYAEYAQEMADNNGNCGFFALDTENHKFKVPTLHKISVEATKITGDIGNYIQDQIVNITGTFGADDRMTNVHSGAFSPLGSGYGTGSSGSESGWAFNFDASAVVNTGDRVKPRTISLRAMVQLANEVDDAVSIESYTNRLEEATEDGISALNNASNCLTQTQVTNCILEAPENWLTYSGNTITLHSGFKALVCNGRNADKTLKNTEVSITADIEYQLYAPNQTRNLFLASDGGIFSASTTIPVYTQEVTPTVFLEGYAFWYKPSENKSYWAPNNSTFIPLCAFKIAEYTTDANDNIISLTPVQPMDVLKRSDFEEIMSLALPSNKVIPLTVGSSGSYYIAPADGYFTCGLNQTASNFKVAIYTTSNVDNSIIQVSNYAYGGDSAGTVLANVPIRKGDRCYILYNKTPDVFLFTYAQGVY